MIARWIEFNGRPKKRTNDRMHVTINEKGVLLMNRTAWETLGSPEAVRLFFDEVNDMIGLKPSEITRTNAFPIRGNKYSRVIYANPFCVLFGFQIERTMVFNEVEMDEHGILRLRFRTATAISRPRRKRSH